MKPQKEKILRNKIFSIIKLIYKARKKNEVFIPGKTYVNYAGRVYDEKEMISLVDSALDFWLTLGRYGKMFEKRFSELLGIKHVILANSGSSANLLAVSCLMSQKLGAGKLNPGDEIITTAASFPTTVNPIIQNNLVPVFVDINAETYNIMPERIERAVSEKTRAIFVSHTLGNPVDVEKIQKIAGKHRLYFIEDACDALGSRYKGRMLGTFGDIATFSFYPAHHITMGEGGAVVTDSPLLSKIMISIRDWGKDCWCDTGEDNKCGKRFCWKLGNLPYGYDHKYIYSHIGYNLKPLDLQPAIGVEQLKKLGRFTRARKRNFRALLKHLKKYEKYFIFPKSHEGSDPCWFGFVLTVRNGCPFTKKQIVEFLEEKKIAARMLFAGNIISQPAYKDIKHRVSGGLENTDNAMYNTFWIGVYPGLDRNKTEYILKMFDVFIEKYEK